MAVRAVHKGSLNKKLVVAMCMLGVCVCVCDLLRRND